MKTVCKKLLSLMLVAVLLVSAVPMMASAASAGKVTVHVKHGADSSSATEVASFSVTPSNGTDTTVDNLIYYYIEPRGYAVGEFGGAFNNTTGKTIGRSDAVLVDEEVTIRYTGSTGTGGSTSEPTVPVTEPHVHSYDTYVRTEKAATCTETGVDVYQCSCSAEEARTTDALGHKWNEGKVIVEATASTQGEILYTCNVCGETKTEKYSADTRTINFVNSYVSGSNPVSYTFVLNKTMSIPAGTPIAGYTFKGWFSDTNGEGTQLTDGTTCTNNLAFTYYAYYIKDVKFDYDVYLNIYTNNKVDAPAKRINITSGIAADGVVSLSEVKSVVQSYYTSKDSNGITYDGLYKATGDWVDKFNRNDKEDTFSNIGDLKEQDNVFINVMITNVKEKTSSSSGSTADSSNPKTGDGIYTTVAVFGLSVASLAAVYYIGKKRFAC